MNILILGTHGQKNLGDELLLSVFLHHLRDSADEVYVNSYDPRQTEEYYRRFNIKAFHTRNNPFAILSALLKCQVIVFAGGNIVKELNSDYGGATYQTLKMLNIITSLGSLLPGRMLIMSNIGIGPIRTDQGHVLAKRILRRLPWVAVRDQESYQYAMQFMPKGTVRRVPDAVFSLKPSFFKLAAGSLAENTKPRKIVVSLCRNLEKGGNWDHFQQRLVEDMVRFHNEHPEIVFVGLPMQSHVATNDDFKALTELKLKTKAAAPAIVFDIEDPTSVEDVAAIINAADIVMAERLHCIILATVFSKPFIALEYDVKVSNIVKDLGMGSRGINISEEIPEGAIYSLLDSTVSGYAQASGDIKAISIEEHIRATDYFDELRTAIKEGGR